MHFDRGERHRAVGAGDRPVAFHVECVDEDKSIEAREVECVRSNTRCWLAECRARIDAREGIARYSDKRAGHVVDACESWRNGRVGHQVVAAAVAKTQRAAVDRDAIGAAQVWCGEPGRAGDSDQLIVIDVDVRDISIEGVGRVADDAHAAYHGTRLIYR